MKKRFNILDVGYWLIVTLMVWGSLRGQEARPPSEQILELQVLGFRAGLVTDIPNAQMPNNALRDVENYAFTKEDGLAIRKAFVLWNATDTTLNDSDIVAGLFGYYKGNTQELIAVMRDDTSTTNAALNQILKINLTTGATDTNLFPYAFRRGLTDNIIGSFWSTVHEDSILYIANANMEVMVYDGNKVYPLRPLGPGQPASVVLGSEVTGNVGPGNYTYRYVYWDQGGGGGDGERTLYSSATFKMYVPENGRVYLYNLARPFDETKFDIQVYRSKADGDTLYLLTVLTGAGDTTYVDNIADASLNVDSTPPTLFGFVDHLRQVWDSTATDRTHSSDSLFPPGSPWAFLEERNSTLGRSIVRGMFLGIDHQGDWVSYSVVYVDSNGFYSVPSPPALMIDTAWDDGDSTWQVEFPAGFYLNGGGVNQHLSAILLLKKYQSYGTEGDEHPALPTSKAYWEYVDDDSAAADSPVSHLMGGTYLFDSIDLAGEGNMVQGDNFKDGNLFIDLTTLPDVVQELDFTREGIASEGFDFRFRRWTGAVNQTLEEFSLLAADSAVKYLLDSSHALAENIAAIDSSIYFKPGSITLYNGRIFATVDQIDLNQMFYSQSRNNTKFASSGILSFPTGDGDWFVSVVSVEDGILGFKQNNLYALRGSRIIDFRADKAFDSRGAIAPKSITVSNRNVTYLHDEGIIRWNLSGSNPVSISIPIQSVFDSLGYAINKWSAAAIINDDYWLSINDSDATTINNTVYIFDTERNAWLKYTRFGFQTAVQFDTERSYGDWHSRRYIFGSNRNRLYKYLYDVADTIDGVGATAGDTISTLLETKFFFDSQPGHRKIYYVDLVGEGLIDSCKVTLLGNLRVNTYDTLETIYESGITFASNLAHRFYFSDVLTRSAAIRIETFTGSKHIIKGMNLGYRDWDRKKDG